MTGQYSRPLSGDDRSMADDLARAFGVDAQSALTVVRYVLQEFSYALEELTLSRGGMADLLDTAGRYLGGQDSPVSLDLDSPESRVQGNRLLAQIFDSKYKSRVLARRVARRSGLDGELVKKMLPAVAILYMDRIVRETRGAFGRVAKNVRPADDGLEKAGSGDPFSGQEPISFPDEGIPQPGADRANPYDDLSDIIRRGGRPSGGAPGGGYLWSIVRNILGGVLGFKNRGIVGWIISMIVYRWGWSILKAIFRRVVLAR